MRQYIDADELIEFANNTKDKTIDANDIARFPTADVRENVRGEWLNTERIEDDKAEYITEWQQAQCSVCHKWHTTPYMFFIKKNERHYTFTNFNFCPNCGADMRGE